MLLFVVACVLFCANAVNCVINNVCDVGMMCVVCVDEDEYCCDCCCGWCRHCYYGDC